MFVLFLTFLRDHDAVVKKHHLISVLWYQEVISVHTGKIAYRSFDKPNKDEKWNTIKNETLFSACLLNLTYFGLVFAQRVFRLVQTRREMSWLLLKIPFFFVAVNEAGNCPEVSWKISSGLTQKMLKVSNCGHWLGSLLAFNSHRHPPPPPPPPTCNANVMWRIL